MHVLLISLFNKIIDCNCHLCVARTRHAPCICAICCFVGLHASWVSSRSKQARRLIRPHPAPRLSSRRLGRITQARMACARRGVRAHPSCPDRTFLLIKSGWKQTGRIQTRLSPGEELSVSWEKGQPAERGEEKEEGKEASVA